MTKTLLVSLLALGAGIGCGGGSSFNDTLATQAITTYSDVLSANYAAALAGATDVQAKIDALVAAPSDTTLKAARDAWLAARPIYSRSEMGRFYDGPIEEVEGQINAWPIDENYIDYVEGMPTAGIINDTSKQITEDTIKAANEQGGEKNISTGWHAIEFLLWGQDKSTTGPGDRPFTDYTTAANADRRGQYLKLTAKILVEDLTAVNDQWKTGGAFRTTFAARDPKAAIANVLTGLGALAVGEAGGERSTVPYNVKAQEQEQSCFSDNTADDLENNIVGIQNAILGKYGNAVSGGTSIEALVRDVDAATADALVAAAADCVAKAKAIPRPFDQAILGEDTAPGRVAVKAFIDSAAALGEAVATAATKLGVKINLE